MNKKTSNLMLEKEMKEIKTIKETLDRRVAELQMKAERVTMLENERKRFQDREAHFTEATNKIKEELEEAERKNQELLAQLEEYENTGGPQLLNQNFLKDPNVDRRSFGKNRESMMPRMSMMASGLLGNLSNLSDIMKTSGGREDDFETMNLIQKLMLENTYLKSSYTRETLEKMSKTMPKFNIYMNKLKRRRQGADAEDILGITQISKLSNLQKMIKLTLCERSVVDLTKCNPEERVELAKNYLENEANDLKRLRYQAYEITSNILEKFRNLNENNFRQSLDPEIQESLQNLEKMPLVARLRPTQKLGSSQTLRNKKTIMTMSEFLEFKNRVIA